jgi:hypothetical protein
MKALCDIIYRNYTHMAASMKSLHANRSQCSCRLFGTRNLPIHCPPCSTITACLKLSQVSWSHSGGEGGDDGPLQPGGGLPITRRLTQRLEVGRPRGCRFVQVLNELHVLFNEADDGEIYHKESQEIVGSTRGRR